MTTTKDVLYDSFCHEMHIGMTVMAHTSGGYIYGHIVDMVKDTKGNEKYMIVPDLGYSESLKDKLGKQYKINWRNVYQIEIKKKIS